MNDSIKNITIQDFLAFIVSVGVFGLILCKYAVPEQVWSAWMVILTFFFSKPNNSTITTNEAPKTGA